MTKKTVLGRGLGALMNDAGQENNTSIGNVTNLEISKIEINPYQPRTDFESESLAELADSIKKLGLIQPVTVRKIDENRYQLISGERRLRAATSIGFESIPAYIRTANDEEMLVLALVENVQREDLNAIEMALGYKRLMEECRLTQDAVSDRVGKQRSTVTNYIRLLKLPAEVQLGLKEKKIAMGHAKALINVEDPEMQTMIFHQIIKYDFSVRKVEDVVREINSENNGSCDEIRKPARSLDEYNQLKDHLTKYFNSNIEFIRKASGKGKIIIPFHSDDDLERIIEILDRPHIPEE